MWLSVWMGVCVGVCVCVCRGGGVDVSVYL